MKRTVVWFTVWVAALLAGVAVGQELRVPYEGELIDSSARPLSGVFDLRFKLFESAEATEPVWEEQHFVAVYDGEYAIDLGSRMPIDTEMINNELLISVEFLGQEILREPLVLQAPEREEDEPSPLQELLMTTELQRLTFAQLADRAIVAERAQHAADCDTLEGHTLSEIDRTDEVLERIEEHVDDSSVHGGGRAAPTSRARVGSSTTVLQRVGGDGGARYTRMCPAGYVVVGMRGGAGVLIDAFELVCAPIE